MANLINIPATTPEEWARKCAANRAGDKREWTVAATNSGDSVDDLSGAPIKGGLRQQSEPIELSGEIGRLRLEASDAMKVETLFVRGPFAGGVSFGAQSGREDEAYVEIEADTALLAKISLSLADGGVTVGFAQDAEWAGQMPKMTAVLPNLRKTSISTGAKVAMGAFGAGSSAEIVLDDSARAQLSLPVPGFMKKLTATALGESFFMVSVGAGGAAPGERWHAQEGIIMAMGKARADLQGVSFDNLRLSARNQASIGKVWAHESTLTATGRAVLEGEGPEGKWTKRAEIAPQAPAAPISAPKSRPRAFA